MSWYNPYSWGASDEQARADSLDAQLAALNARDYGPGGEIYNTIAARDGTAAADAARQATVDHLATQVAQDRDIAGQEDAAFSQGLSEGAGNIRGTVDTAVFGTIKALLKSVPISVWIAAVVFAVIYFGGWAWLSRRLLK